MRGEWDQQTVQVPDEEKWSSSEEKDVGVLETRKKGLRCVNWFMLGLFSDLCVFFFVEKCLNVTNVEKVCRLLMVM